ncbi:MAG: glycogen synthase [Acholeplasmataceae bacterium]|jgi:starch synthase|nr:glycogen synthase [Acholeplasmataceae bacterium]
MRILFCSSEVVPFSKTGGLADVSGSLPKEIAKTQFVTVITPLYEKHLRSIYNLKSLGNRSFLMKNERITVNYYFFIKENVKYVFVNHEVFLRDSFYGYLDDNKRFFIFNYAIMEYLLETTEKYDLIHLNDWQTALIPYLQKNNYQASPISKIKTLLSIHNLQYQGSFNIDTFLYTNNPFSYDYIHFDTFNFLKTGILLSDAINTVSETYRDEIQTQYFGHTLDGLLKNRQSDLYGILNGIDNDLYNPESDANIAFNYNKNRFVSGKRANKSLFLKTANLDDITSIPLVSFISRLTTQKGIDLMMATLEEAISQSNANFAIIGSGEQRYESFFQELADRYPQRVFCHIGFSNRLAQQLYAASDIFMMPSLFEPCGLSQMIAMRYGTLPVVRETGGLKDTVIPYNKHTNEGDGFSFKNYNAHEFKDTLLMAINLYNNNQHVFRILQNQAMRKDFSLTNMGNKYLTLYQKIINS